MMPSPSSSSSVDRRRPGRSSSPPLTDPDGDTDTDTIVGTKSLYWFTALLWCAFFAAMIVLLLVLIRHQEALAKQADPTDSRPRLIPPKELARLVLVLRSNDYRLVRPHPTPATVAQQNTWCPPKMASLLLTLCASHGGGRRRRRRSQKSRGKQKVSLQKRGMAAEAVALCLTNQPQYRDLAANATLFQNLRTMHKQLLVGDNDDNNNDTTTTIELSLAKGLTDLLQQGITYYQKHQDRQAVTAMAQAAEAVWIASFHHPTHIHNFLQHNTIQVLGDIIVTNRPKAFQNGNNSVLEFPYRPAHAVMWACAALQNLAAHYCQNNGGFCTWEWQQVSNQNPVLALKDRNDSLEQPELAHQARQQILAIPNLLETLAEWICFVGPIHAPINETYGWPGDAKLWKGLTPTTHSPHLRSPSIVPWAAAGVIKNLLLLLLNSDDDNHKLRERLQAHHSLPECLCRMKQHSPDWLERDKASDAVYFWGPPPQQQHVCGGSSDNEQEHGNYVSEQKDEVEQDDERGTDGVANVNKNGKEGDEGVEGGDARGDEVVTDEESDSKAPHEEL